jgi:hypothetical protein
MTKPDLRVVTLFESNYRDPVASLRRLADEIEAGDFGEVGCIGIALLGDTMEVFGAGPDSDGTSVATVLHAGTMRLTKAVERHGR